MVSLFPLETNPTFMKLTPFLLFVFFLTLITSTQAQSGVTVTKISGEVIEGVLTSGLDQLNSKEVTILVGEDEVILKKGEISSLAAGHQIFLRYILQVDTKSILRNQLTRDKEPEFALDTVLLERIASGPVNLYRLADKNEKEHFFIQSEQELPFELVFTRYIQYDENGRTLPVKENNRYKMQLAALFDGCTAVFSLINQSSYNWNDLAGIIKTGSINCLGADQASISVTTAPKALLETELSVGIGTGYLYLSGDQFPYDLSEAKNSIKPGYWGSLAFAYYPTVLKGNFALVTEISAFNLSQEITAEDFTSENIYKNYNQQIAYHYLSLNLILRKIMKGKNKPFWQVGYSYGFAYHQENPLEEEIFFFGVLRYDNEPSGFLTRNQENALVAGGGIMPGNLMIKLVGRISTGSTVLPSQSSLHFLGHLCIGYRF